ncbi:permease [Phenylobacterium soli]|uniref:Permease n=1 Tax=Phenylobacterium soli TaxID=2170551 RepID=A0A328A948_9CAUL|nr:permease [Phenylobacterium soli]RAK51172.1 permease [Phenylobacterium soli]
MTTQRINRAPYIAALAFVAVAGLLYVKWLPYWNRAFVAAAQHAIGKSILTAGADHPPAPSLQAALAYALAYGKAIWQAMVLGLVLGSGVQALLPREAVQRLLGGKGFGSALAGGLLALPGMMCTCCAAPVVAGLRRQQAAAGAAVAFWLGNTVLNPATLVFTGFVLGWHWTALRLALGVPMVFGLGWLVNRMTTAREAAQAQAALSDLPVEPAQPPLRRWASLLGRMTVRLVPEYVVLVLVLGFARAWLFPAIGPEVGNHLGWILAFAVAGMLFVIPTAGEVPIVQAMLKLGVGAGPAGALLMTLPPISLPSLAMLSRSFPPRVLAVIAGAVVLFGLAAAGLAIALGF